MRFSLDDDSLLMACHSRGHFCLSAVLVLYDDMINVFIIRRISSSSRGSSTVAGAVDYEFIMQILYRGMRCYVSLFM